LSAAGTEAVAAQNGPSCLWFERYGIRLATLVTDYVEALAFVTTRAWLGSSEAGPARIAAGLTPLRMAQTTLTVIVLFSFSKWEAASTLGASDFQIRHILSRDLVSPVVGFRGKQFTAGGGCCTEI